MPIAQIDLGHIHMIPTVDVRELRKQIREAVEAVVLDWRVKEEADEVPHHLMLVIDFEEAE